MIQIKNLSVKYDQGFTLYPIDLLIDRGEIVSVVGESGSGKTTFAKAIVKMLGASANVSGSIIINGENILDISQSRLKDLRMTEFSICFQNSGELLNPLLTIREQIFEVLIKKYPKKQLERKAEDLIEDIGLDKRILNKYPNQLSGGMLQKILILISVCLKPKFVVLDEPTSSLDMDSKNEVIQLIKKMNQEHKISFLIITHDLGIAKALSKKMLILYEGKLVESGDTLKIISKPRHPYTRGLIYSSMDVHPYRDIWGIRYEDYGDKDTNGCPFFSRCTQGFKICKDNMPELTADKEDTKRYIACNRGGIIKILQGSGITKSFGKDRILDSINIELLSGEIVSLVGASGIGKTTLSKILGGYLGYDKGTILFEEEEADFKNLHKMINGVQMVFQDPSTSINPNLSVIDAISEPFRLAYKQRDYLDLAKKILIDVGLPNTESFLNTKIKYLSGGQKQRISIGRALIMKPKVLIADEPTSMLDASSKANLLRLLKGIQNSRGFSMIMITHDIFSAIKISDRIYQIDKDKKMLEITNTDFSTLIFKKA